MKQKMIFAFVAIFNLFSSMDVNAVKEDSSNGTDSASTISSPEHNADDGSEIKLTDEEFANWEKNMGCIKRFLDNFLSSSPEHIIENSHFENGVFVSDNIMNGIHEDVPSSKCKEEYDTDKFVNCATRVSNKSYSNWDEYVNCAPRARNNNYDLVTQFINGRNEKFISKYITTDNTIIINKNKLI